MFRNSSLWILFRDGFKKHSINHRTLYDSPREITQERGDFSEGFLIYILFVILETTNYCFDHH